MASDADFDNGVERHFIAAVEGMKFPDSSVTLSVPMDETRTLGVLGMVSIGFFWVCGGYGTENLIAAAPPGIVALALLGAPLFYALPFAMMVGELATALPEDGGSIVWVSYAFGKTMGLHNSWWSLIAWLVDSAVYPVLAAHYILAADDECANSQEEHGRCFYWRAGLSIIIVAVITAIKFAGLKLIVRFSTFMAITSLVPLLMFCGASFPYVNIESFTDFEGTREYKQDYALLMSLLLWLNCGFLGIGVLAGQVRPPVKRTYSVSIVLLLIGSSVIHFLPILAAISQDRDQNNYKSGYFAVLAARDIGPFMINAFQVGAGFSMIGLYNAQSMQTELTLGFILKQVFPRFVKRQQEHGSCIWQTREGNTRMYMLTNALATAMLVTLPYEVLLEGSMLVGALSDIMVISAFFKLRFWEPNLPRPFKAFESNFLSMLMMSLPTIALFTNIGLNLNPSSHNFIPVATFMSSAIGSGILLHLAAKLCGCTTKDDGPLLTSEKMSSSYDSSYDQNH